MGPLGVGRFRCRRRSMLGWGSCRNRRRGVLRLAAVLGPRFSVTHLGLLASRPATDLAGVIAEAVTAGVLVESEGRLAFRHELIREALMEGMPESLRVALHRQAAQSLAEAGAPVEQVAQQLLAAPQVDDSWAVGWVVEVVPGLTYRAPHIVVELVERVRPGIDRDDPRGERLAAHLATALVLLGRDEQVERLARPVLAGTRDPEVAGRMAWSLGYALGASGAGRADAGADRADAGRAGAAPGVDGPDACMAGAGP